MSRKTHQPPFHRAEWAIFAAVLIAVHVLSSAFQEHTTVNQGLGWDGRIYYHMALQFFQDDTVAQRSPFVYRQFTPWLAAALSDSPRDLLENFHAVNLFFTTLTSILILLLLQPLIRDWRIRVFAAALFPLHGYAALRWSYFESTHVTPVACFSFAATLYLLQKIRGGKNFHLWLALLCIVAFVAAANRSSYIALALAAPLCLAVSAATFEDKLKALFDKKYLMRRLLLLLPFAAGVMAYMLVRQEAEVTGYYGEEKGGGASTSFYFITKLYEQPLLWYLQELFIAYGPMLVLILWKRREIADQLGKNWHWLYFTLLYLLFSALSSAVRQLLAAMPLYIILLALAIQAGLPTLLRHRLLMAALIIAQMISQRVFWIMPHDLPAEPVFTDPSTPAPFPYFFTPLTGDFLLYDVFPYLVQDMGREGFFYGPVVCAQYIGFTAVMLYLLVKNDSPAGRAGTGQADSSSSPRPVRKRKSG